jgi:hypothetical protein
MVTTVPAGPVSGQKEVTEGRTVSGDAEATLAPVVWIAIGPLTASAGTVAVICVGESRVKVTVAAEPAKPTALTELRLVPVIVSGAPGATAVGANDVMVGSPAKSALAVAVPAGVVIVIGPPVTPVGTVAVTCVADSTLNDAAGVAPKRTAVAPARFAPVSLTTVPAPPPVGSKVVTAGDDTVNFAAATPVLTGVVTEISPVTALGGTVTVIAVGVTELGVVGRPLNFTAVAPAKLTPEIVSVVPAGPDTGPNEAIAGDVVVKQVSLVTGVRSDTIAIGPGVAPPGTAVVISVAEITLNEVTGVPLKVTLVTSAKFAPVM